jgi:hypothetical protein
VLYQQPIHRSLIKTLRTCVGPQETPNAKVLIKFGMQTASRLLNRLPHKILGKLTVIGVRLKRQ